MKIAAVSPHLDDAALSASARIGAGGATVLTVFTALPPDGWPVTSWDRLTGAADSRQRQRERLAEDAAAMRLLSARGVHLNEPEALYRKRTPSLNRAVRRMTKEFTSADEVWLPSAIGGHRDHKLARDAGLRAARAAGHKQVILYADFPYVIAYGWPAWVSGEPAGPFLDADAWLDRQLISAGLDPAALTATVTRLTPAQRQAKAAIIAAYRTQAPALRLAPADLAREQSKLDFEMSWHLELPEAERGEPPG